MNINPVNHGYNELIATPAAEFCEIYLKLRVLGNSLFFNESAID